MNETEIKRPVEEWRDQKCAGCAAQAAGGKPRTRQVALHNRQTGQVQAKTLPRYDHMCLFPGAKVLKGWAEGQEVTEAQYDEAIQELQQQPWGGK